MSAIVVPLLPSAGVLAHLGAFVRSLFSRRLLLSLVGVETVMLAGRVYAVRPVPLKVARDLVPAIVRCSQAFVRVDLAEALYDDLVKALALGLGVSIREIGSLSVSLWDLAPVIDLIARVNGLQTAEAGTADMGKLLAALTQTGTNSTPGSSVPPAGAGSTLTNA